MLEFLSDGNKTCMDMVNDKFVLVPKMLEAIDVYFKEEDEKKVNNLNDDKVKAGEKEGLEKLEDPSTVDNVDVDVKTDASENNVRIIGDVSPQYRSFVNELMNGSSSCYLSQFFDLSGCLVIGDIHGNMAALLHVSDLIDKMMFPSQKYILITII